MSATRRGDPRRSRAKAKGAQIRARARPRVPGPALPASSLRHPAAWFAVAVAFAAVLVSVTTPIFDTDFWQHLAVGRAIWSLHHVPATQLWSWPTHGAPDANASWGFRVLLWPFWTAGGAWGLQAWRWLTALAAFALLWAAARRMGAAGLSALVAIVVCALVYRQRSLVRPENVVAVLLALELWVLETRRRGGRDLTAWLPAVALAWANVHISWPLGLVVLGAYALDDAVRPRGPRTPKLGLVLLAGVAATFVNPFGVRAVLQPFEFFLSQRGEPLYRSIPELQPLPLARNLRNGLPLLLAGWPVLLVWRARRRGLDLAEAVLCPVCIALAFSSQRFLGFLSVVAAPFLARDLDAWVRTRAWPAWTSPAWARAGLAAGACVALGLPEWTRAELPFGTGIREEQFPVVACDFMAEHGVQGRGFNPFYLGGYLLYRFWPDPGRLPFMDIHMAGKREDRDALALAGSDPRVFPALDRRYRFDWALVRRIPYEGDQLLEYVERDTAFALVFMDEAAALFVRRTGPMAPIAERFAYRTLGAGREKLAALNPLMFGDRAVRSRVVRELEREANGSPLNGQALTRLGAARLLNADVPGAKQALTLAVARHPRTLRAHEWLGTVALTERRPADALREFEAEWALGGGKGSYDRMTGIALARMGEFARARAAFARAVQREPRDREAADSLRAMERRLAR